MELLNQLSTPYPDFYLMKSKLPACLSYYYVAFLGCSRQTNILTNIQNLEAGRNHPVIEDKCASMA